MPLHDDLRTAGNMNDALRLILADFGADSGTIHLLADDGELHLKASSEGLPPAVVDLIRVIPVGKGMAGLAVERNRPVDSCNIQSDESGDVRPGALQTGLQGAITVPIRRDGAAVGALGIANAQPRTFTDDEVGRLLEAAGVIGEKAKVESRK